MTEFCSLLIANRGEIACRIIRSARELGLRTVAVFSEADRSAPHVSMADQSVCIGPAPASESYLDIARLIEAAVSCGAEAIHPGYGFLSESAAFAAACEGAGLVFVGPSPEAIALMGNKAEAKRQMVAAGVPCVAGYEGQDQSDSAFRKAAKAAGYPVMIKAAAGGGGRGMRLVKDPEQLSEALAIARSEAESAFGSPELILEKAIDGARHVEVQILGDRQGNIVHLGERDCSVQRRHQKVIEETPSPAVDDQLRRKMGENAVAAARAISYVGAGTVEFLLDGSGNFFFLEMNTRLQVEHPVTEMITGLDLVALQIRIAQGHSLGFDQNALKLSGHAMEARLYAEDAKKGFVPAAGRIVGWHAPSGEGVRVDAGIEAGVDVPPYYDPMLAKIVAWGGSRDEARRRLVSALEQTDVFGIETNRDFLLAVLQSKAFAGGEATTTLVDEDFLAHYKIRASADFEDVAIAAVLRHLSMRDRSMELSGRVPEQLAEWSSLGQARSHYSLLVEEQRFELSLVASPERYVVGDGENEAHIEVLERTGGQMRLRIDGKQLRVRYHFDDGRVSFATSVKTVTAVDRRAESGASGVGDGGGNVVALMHGRITEIAVSVGDSVATGQKLAVLEAMKMQHQLASAANGRIRAVHVKAGSQVGAGDLLIEIEPAEGTELERLNQDA